MEPFGVEFERPAQPDCPDCECCSADLCALGRDRHLRCAGRTAQALRANVEHCPCSAATTPETAAWRVDQVFATRRARERPVPADVEAYLRALDRGEVWAGGDIARAPWENEGLTSTVEGRPVITDLGRTYLAARTDVWSVTPVRVVGVDKARRVVRVEVPAWRVGEPVTVLLSQIVGDLGVSADALPRWVSAEANCEAPDARRLVLTRFRPRVDDGTAVTRVGAVVPDRLVHTRFQDPPRLPAGTGPFASFLDQSDDGDVL